VPWSLAGRTMSMLDVICFCKPKESITRSHTKYG